MKKKAVTVMLTLLAISWFTFTLNVQFVKAQGVIYIRIDGSVDPSTAPIQRNGDVYTFTADINGSLLIERSNIVIDGNNFKLQGAGGGTGLQGIILARNVIIQNIVVTGFSTGIQAYGISLIKNSVITGNSLGIITRQTWGLVTISDNILTNNSEGIFVDWTAANILRNILSINGLAIRFLRSGGNNWINNTIANNDEGIMGYCIVSSKIIGNNFSNNGGDGLMLSSAIGDNVISDNIIEYNHAGFNLTIISPDGDSTSNSIMNNTFAYNDIGLWMSIAPRGGGNSVYGNFVYHNNFIDNLQQVYSQQTNYWDDGYPSGGNYWSDYVGVDIKQGSGQTQPGSDGIGDTPYTIDANNRDGYPLMYPFGSPSPTMYALTITISGGGTTNPTAGTYSYSQEQNVPVQATPNSGYYLDHWELDGINVGNEASYTVTMNAPHTLTAIFEPPYPEVPEFPLGPMFEVVFIPVLMYLWWKRKQESLSK